jgi:predicted restriction endonuclease
MIGNVAPMPLSELTRDAVLAAGAEHDRLGREAFLAKYGFQPARTYLLEYEGRSYDSKAIAGVAHQYATGHVLTAAEFSGGFATVGRVLERLGFSVPSDGSPTGTSRPARRFGHVPGASVGQVFRRRTDASSYGVHRPTQAGISGTGREGADSIVISGGYADDQDLGDVIIYTGHGGRDPNTGKQVADQRIEDPGNAGLITSQLEGLPVRVVRAPVKDSLYAPTNGYRYDGLYRVDSHWLTTGRDGYRIVQFRLESIPDTDHPRTPPARAPGEIEPSGPVERRPAIIQRQVRSTQVAQRVKQLHDHHCQVCGTRLGVEGGYYAEGAHIRPLGAPHAGPDALSNILCLCPNDHVRFDNGGLVVLDDLTVLDTITSQPIGTLRTVPAHEIDLYQLAYHRDTRATSQRQYSTEVQQ